MVTIRADEIEKNWPNYLHLVKSGESLIITQADEPVAEVNPIVRKNYTPGPFGLCAGEFTVPADFDAPLPENVLDAFEGR